MTVASQRWRSWAADGSGGIPQLFFCCSRALGPVSNSVVSTLHRGLFPRKAQHIRHVTLSRLSHRRWTPASIFGRKENLREERKKKRLVERCPSDCIPPSLQSSAKVANGSLARGSARRDSSNLSIVFGKLLPASPKKKKLAANTLPPSMSTVASVYVAVMKVIQPRLAVSAGDQVPTSG